MAFKKCCCFSVRTGTLIIACLGAFLNLFSTIGYSVSLAKEQEIREVIDDLESSYAKLHDEQQLSDEEYYAFVRLFEVVRYYLHMFLIAGVVVAVVSLVIHAMLITGVNTRRPGLMTPWLIVSAIGLALQTGGIIYHCFMRMIYIDFGQGLLNLGICLPFLAIGYLLWMVVFSAYKEIKTEKLSEDRLPVVTEEVLPDYEDIVKEKM